ncbi:MAG: HIT family protein, partial [Ktedonobacterales bacterium]|nr:HIT family protein [Ktedonobacterales bacterium]
MECYPCLANAGKLCISPGPVIHDGTYWTIDHAYPAQLAGWVVLVLKRHAEAPHELVPAEWAEMGDLLGRMTRALRDEMGCEKEYVACFAEGDHFHHIHIHVVPKPATLAPAFYGPRCFALLKPGPGEAVPPEEVRDVCVRLRERRHVRRAAAAER